MGKTTTCANLGIGLAQAGKKVLLIDGDPQGSLTISLGNPQPDKLPFTLSDAMGRILTDPPRRGDSAPPGGRGPDASAYSAVRYVIRESIEDRANEICKAKEEQRAAPIYPHSAAYASEHGEMAQYRASLQVSLACKEAIGQAINAHYGDNRLNTEAAVKEVLEQFGPERVQKILTQLSKLS